MSAGRFSSKEEFAEWFKARTKKFAIDVINYCKKLPYNQATRVVTFQVIKSATSVAANYRAACRGRSGAEFYSKICTVVEEADESVFWLEMAQGAKFENDGIELDRLLKEASEILFIAAKARKTASSKN